MFYNVLPFFVIRSRLDGQLDYKKNVEVLQSRVAELEKRNRLAEKRLSDLNAECEEREKKLENQYNDNLQGLTNEVARTKHDFENNLQVKGIIIKVAPDVYCDDISISCKCRVSFITYP